MIVFRSEYLPFVSVELTEKFHTYTEHTMNYTRAQTHTHIYTHTYTHMEVCNTRCSTWKDIFVSGEECDSFRKNITQEIEALNM
jgi:hypothetical protein